MLRFLLDEHISPAIAKQLLKKDRRFVAIPLRDWQAGRFLGTADSIWIPELIKEQLTLVTYDRASITPLLRNMAAQGIDHHGVIFIDEKSIAQSNLGGLVKALEHVAKCHGSEEWLNRVVYLKG